jgi:hypothetical protein
VHSDGLSATRHMGGHSRGAEIDLKNGISVSISLTGEIYDHEGGWGGEGLVIFFTCLLIHDIYASAVYALYHYSVTVCTTLCETAQTL